MLIYITYLPLVFYFSTNPYLITGFRFLVGYSFFGPFFRVGSVNGIVLSQISSLVLLFSVICLFYIWSICLESSIVLLIRTLYILELILSTVFPCCHFCFDPYLLIITLSFRGKVRNAKFFLIIYC